MKEKAKSVWFTNDQNIKLAPYTTSSQVIMHDGNTMDNAWANFQNAVQTSIPTKTSDLTNNSNFQTKIQVQDLIKQEVADVTGISYQICYDGLPGFGQVGVIYLVPRNSFDSQNVYDEYIWVDNQYELLGGKQKTEENTSGITQEELTQQLATLEAKINRSIPTTLPANGGNSASVGGYKIKVLSETDYNTTVKDPGTIYFIYEGAMV